MHNPATVLAQETNISELYEDNIYGNHSDSSLSAWDPDKGGDGHIINYLDGTNGMVYGALLSSASVTGNTVNAYDGTTSFLIGGATAGAFDVIGNTVNFNDGVTGTIIGGYAASSGNAEENTVNISGGTVNYKLNGKQISHQQVLDIIKASKG